MALRRPRHIERAAHREMLSLVVQHMQLGGVEIAPGDAVADERVVVPTVPQPAHDLDELDRTFVALAMLIMLLAAEIVGLREIRRGHYIPSGAAGADMIERRELAGDVIGLVIAGRGGGAEADMGRHGRER